MSYKITQEEERILLVDDRDFGELILYRHLAHAGVIFFRLSGAPLQFLVVTPGRIRVAGRPRSYRSLPVGKQKNNNLPFSTNLPFSPLTPVDNHLFSTPSSFR